MCSFTPPVVSERWGVSIDIFPAGQPRHVVLHNANPVSPPMPCPFSWRQYNMKSRVAPLESSMVRRPHRSKPSKDVTLEVIVEWRRVSCIQSPRHHRGE